MLLLFSIRVSEGPPVLERAFYSVSLKGYQFVFCVCVCVCVFFPFGFEGKIWVGLYKSLTVG